MAKGKNQRTRKTQVVEAPGEVRAVPLAEHQQLQNQYDQANKECARLLKQVQELEGQLDSRAQLAPGQLVDAPPLEIAQGYDPLLLGSLVGVLRDRINSYPLEDQEFDLIAPKFVLQALRLHRMIEAAIMEERGGHQRDDDDSEMEAPRKGGPVLP